MKAYEPKRIAVMISGNSDMLHDIWYGILSRMQQDRRYWISQASLNEEGLELAREWKADVIIAHMQRRETIDLLQQAHCPVVNTSGILADPPFPSVVLDSRLTGEMAADHLLAKNYRNFAYLGPEHVAYSRQRLQGLQARVSTLGHKVRVLHTSVPEQGMRSTPLRSPSVQTVTEWIASLPDHTGLLVPDDYVARAVLQLPDLDPEALLTRIALISGHHSRLPYFPGISGVRQQEHLWGREAANLAIRLLEEDRTAPSMIQIPPLGVIELETTAGICTDDMEVHNVATYIQRHLHERINVARVVEGASNLGRRALERRFQSVMGHSILEEIQEARMERARQLLLETSMQLTEVAALAGFTDHKHLQRVFTQREGVTPGSYRDRL